MADVTCSIPDCGEPVHAKGHCHRHYSQAWYHANSDRAKQGQAAYRDARRAQERERVAAWRAANRERTLEVNRRWYAEHRAEVLEYRRAYRENNRARIRELNKARKARLRGAPVCDLTEAEWQQIQADWDHRCAYCSEVTVLTQDHVIPLSRGGHHTADNVVPACQPCNSRKGNREASPRRLKE